MLDIIINSTEILKPSFFDCVKFYISSAVADEHKKAHVTLCILPAWYFDCGKPVAV